MKTDIEIARETKLRRITEVAAEAGINPDVLEQYGHYMAKIPTELIDKEKASKSKLILVTAITATKAGIGKTTVSIGLAEGMRKIGKNCIVALREPSLGPVFGMKGGAAGGGYAQVLPMEKINLHFTGDFHAITSAHNTIAALLDNYIYQHAKDGFKMKEVLWKRVLDVNDRNLRQIVTGLGPATNGMKMISGFDITPASEIMAILCLSKDMDDLRRRIDNILLGYTEDGKPFTVKDMGVSGAITVLLMDAIKPNLVQTVEGGPAIIHGGPFANIAHGCNSVIATTTAMSLADYVVTEAGFGADLGAEKFLDIKCRKAGIQPSLTVLVATLNGLKMHGGVPESDIKLPNPEGVVRGFANLDRHIRNLQSFGQSVLVCFNKFSSDTPEEIELVKKHCEEIGAEFALNDAWAKGGEGAMDLARKVVQIIDEKPSSALKFAYSDEMSPAEKIEAVAKKIYGASEVSFSRPALEKLEEASRLGMDSFPVCIAKTQYSFSQDPKAYGAPKDFPFEIRDIVLNTGSEMIVAIAGNIIRMPGLPRFPQALNIDIVNGEITGLS